MRMLLLRPQGEADVILTKPLARLVVFSSSRGADARSRTPKLDTFYSIRNVDDVAAEEQVNFPHTTPHFRQRIASIAGMIFDLDRADWPAISNACDNLRQETKGTPLEKSVELLHEPIRRKHVHALAQTIDKLLRHN